MSEVSFDSDALVRLICERDDLRKELEFVRGQRDTWHTEAVRLAQELDKATKSDKV